MNEIEGWEKAAFVKLCGLGAIVFLPTGKPGEFLLQEENGKLRPPGGHWEKTDKNLTKTIVREVGEEFAVPSKKVRNKIRFLGYEYRPKFAGNAVFEFKGHGLEPGEYQASNSKDEIVVLVKAKLDDPRYNGPRPDKLQDETPEEDPKKQASEKGREESGANSMQTDFAPDYTPQEMEDLAGSQTRLYYHLKPHLASMKKWPSRWVPQGEIDGWISWYQKYHDGHRSNDDIKQIARWQKLKARHGAELKRNPTPRRAWMLVNWGIDPSKLVDEKDRAKLKQDMDAYRSKVDDHVKKAGYEPTWRFIYDHEQKPFFNTVNTDTYEVEPVKMAMDEETSDWLEDMAREFPEPGFVSSEDIEEALPIKVSRFITTGELWQITRKMCSEETGVENPNDDQVREWADKFLERKHKESQEFFAKVKTADYDVGITSVHREANKHGISWDNDVGFMEKCYQLVGKRHLDDMTPGQLRLIKMYIRKDPDSWKSASTKIPDDFTHTHTKTMPDGMKLDILKLIELVKNKVPENVPLTELHGPGRSRKTGFSQDRYAQADVTYPLIVTKDGFVIDGRHRYFKLQDLGQTMAPVVRATPDEIEQAKLGDIKEAKFHRPENWDKIDEFSTKDFTCIAGGNDWEDTWSGVAFEFPYSSDSKQRVYANLNIPKDLADMSGTHDKEERDWGKRVVRRWFNLANEHRKARAKELDIDSASWRPEDFTETADQLGDDVKDYGVERTEWHEKEALHERVIASAKEGICPHCGESENMKTSIVDGKIKCGGCGKVSSHTEWGVSKVAATTPINPQWTGPEAILMALQNLDLDQKEQEAKSVVQRKLKSKRPAAIKVLNYIAGLRKTGVKPHELMLTRVPVIPSQFRPYQVVGDVFTPGDANELYRDLINLIGVHGELEQKLGSGSAFNKLNIYDAMQALYGFGEPTSPKTRERGISGFLKQITGTSPKLSMFQSQMLAKNQDFVARGVVGVDPDLELDEIGVPDEILWKLYAPYIQRSLVRSGMNPEQSLRAIQDRTSLASRALDVELNDRPVVYSRAPSWHKFNVIGGYAKRIPGDMFRVNPLVTTGMNMDFNGDSVRFQHGFVPLLICGQLVTENFESVIAKFITPGYNEKNAIEMFGLGTQIFQLAPESFYVLGLDGNNQPAWVPASAISIHTSHAEECYYVETSRGLMATFTAHHNFVQLDEAAHLVPVKTTQIKPGTLLPVAHGFDIPNPSLLPAAVSCPGMIPNDFQTGFWFGHYLGDGSITGRGDTISQGSTDPLTLSYLENAGRFLNCNPWRDGNSISTRWSKKTSEWIAFFAKHIGGSQDTRCLPGWMMSRSMDFRKGLVAGFITAEGSYGSSMVNIEVVNPDLLVAFRFLMESMKVPCSIHHGKPAKKNRQATYILRASAPELNKLGIPWPEVEKCRQFRNMPDNKRSPEWDRVPLPEWLRPVLRIQGKKFEGGRGRWKTKARLAARVPDYKQAEHGFKLGYTSRRFAEKLMAGFDLENVADMRVQRWIHLVRTKDLCWDVVTVVKPCDRPLVTYDFSVPGMELFAIQGGFLTHNTVNIHVPSMPEAVKDTREKLMPSRMLFSIKEQNKVMPTPKQETVLGLWSAQTRPAKATVSFPDEASALKAIKGGQVRLSDEIKIGELENFGSKAKQNETMD